MATEYSPEVKAAVMAALLTGQSVGEVAKEYNIPKGTIKSWRMRQKANPVAVVATPKKEEIGDLLLEYVRESLKSLRVQTEHFADKDWLTLQGAEALAILHGVQTDKMVRLLEALSRAESGTSAADN